MSKSLYGNKFKIKAKVKLLDKELFTKSNEKSVFSGKDLKFLVEQIFVTEFDIARKFKEYFWLAGE